MYKKLVLILTSVLINPSPFIEEQWKETTFLMSGALREHLPRHGDAGVVIAGVLQSAPTLHPLLPDNAMVMTRLPINRVKTHLH